MTKSKKSIVLSVISYVLIGTVFTLSLIGIITKFNKGTIYLFNTRADVVLSGSMSVKNEYHLDFLKGHDDQYQKFDLVFSSKVTTDDEINVYDVVLYNNPILGTTMHRIVNKTLYSTESYYLNQPTFADFEGQKAIQLMEWTSGITTSAISYDAFEVVLYSKLDNVDNYTFSDGFIEYEKTVTTTKEGDYYKHQIKASGLSTRARMFVFNHKAEFDYSTDYLISVSLDTNRGYRIVTSDNFVKVDDNKYEYVAHKSYLYEIRGDAVKDSDGTGFKIEDIYSKVNFRIPAAGYFIRFITSIWGTILLLGTGFIIIGANFIIERDKKKQKAKAEVVENNNEENNEQK